MINKQIRTISKISSITKIALTIPLNFFYSLVFFSFFRGSTESILERPLKGTQQNIQYFIILYIEKTSEKNGKMFNRIILNLHT